MNALSSNKSQRKITTPHTGLARMLAIFASTDVIPAKAGIQWFFIGIQMGTEKPFEQVMWTIATLISAISTDIMLATAENSSHNIRIISGD